MADSSLPADDVPPAPATDAAQPEPLRARLEDLARQENERAQRRRTAKDDFALRGERLVRDVPPRFFELCTGLREAVGVFNATLDGGEFTVPLRYEESPGVTLRDPDSDDLRVTVWRRGGRFELLLRFMQRAGKPPVPIIEGYGAYGQNLDDRVMVRIEGWIEGGQTVYWYRVDFRKMAIDLKELPERIVMSVVQIEPAALYRSLRATVTDEEVAEPED
jgi:hypothetical protein